ncbi:MAG: serpin family protein [Chloroflexi bacterium]|nr:serpin family protein [Chloroflexota bacterium]
MKPKILTTLIIILLCSACMQASPTAMTSPEPLNEETIMPSEGKVDYNPDPQYVPEEAETLAASINQFGFELFQQMTPGSGNLFVSPYSLYQALTMVYAGARGDTANQFEQTLHLPFPDFEIHRVSNALNLALSPRNENSDESFTLEIANALWAQRDGHIEQDFLDLLSENYASGMHTVDFAEAQEAADLINNWARENTNGKISEIASPDMFNLNTRLALTNAVYFKGAWQHPFMEENTTIQDFFSLEGETIEVDMMAASEDFFALQNDHVQMVELRYANSPIVMDILSPVDGNWEAFSETLTAGLLDTYIEQLSNHKVYLSLPKFKIETPVMDLIAPLQELGLVDVFGMNADLSGMTGDKSLLISTLAQKAFIDVNEAGTEAAAVTIAVAQMKGMMPQEPLTIRFDQPFLYLIRDTQTGAILFIGQLTQP